MHIDYQHMTNFYYNIIIKHVKITLDCVLIDDLLYNAFFLSKFRLTQQHPIMKYLEHQVENRHNSFKAAPPTQTQVVSGKRESTPDSLLLENGNQTISSGYESSECGSTSNVLQSDKNVIEIECNHNTVLTEENLSRVRF